MFAYKLTILLLVSRLQLNFIAGELNIQIRTCDDQMLDKNGPISNQLIISLITLRHHVGTGCDTLTLVTSTFRQTVYMLY